MFNFMRLPPLRRLMLMKAITGGGSWSTISGNPVSFSALSAPLRQLQIAFSPVQSGSGDPSPDNVRPISGWDSLAVNINGTNAWDEVWESGTYGSQNGEASPSQNAIRSKNKFPVLAGQTYAVYNSTANLQVRLYYYDSAGAFKGIAYANCVNNFATFTIPADVSQMNFAVGNSTTPVTTNDKNLSFNYPSTDHDYHAYNPLSRSISISLGDTYYSGWVDVVTGVGEITWAVEDVKNLTFYRYKRADGTTWYFSCQRSGAYCGYDVTEYSKALANEKSNILKTGNPYTNTTACFWAYQQNNYFFIRIGVPNIEEKSDFDAWLQSQTAVQIAYPLAAPITIQLTPEQVNSLAGENVMWSTANGDLTVEYRSN